LNEEDPSLTMIHNPQTHDIVLWGQGEMHLRVALERLRDRFGVDRDVTNLAEPLIPAADLRAHVLAGETMAARRAVTDDGGDLIALVARIRL